jgi:hypothetical protein
VKKRTDNASYMIKGSLESVNQYSHTFICFDVAAKEYEKQDLKEISFYAFGKGLKWKTFLIDNDHCKRFLLPMIFQSQFIHFIVYIVYFSNKMYSYTKQRHALSVIAS